MATDKLPPADPIDGYVPRELPMTAPQHDNNVRAAARDDAEREQNRRGVRWDAATLDGFINALTGLGDVNQDKVLGGALGALKFVVTFLSGTECEDRWRGSDLGGRVVEQIPSEMTRQGFELSVQPDDDETLDEGLDKALERRIDDLRARTAPHVWLAWAREVRTALSRRRRSHLDWPGDDPGAEVAPKAPPPVQPLPAVDEESQRIVEEIEAQLRGLNALDAFREALEYERAYGGAAILLGVADGVNYDLTQPLNTDNIDEVKHLTVFRGGWDGEVIAWRYYNDPRKPKYGLPEVYMLRNLGVPIAAPPAPGESPTKQQVVPVGPAGALTFYVHESRLLVFPGKAVSRRARVQMRGWGDPVFMRVDETLTQYSQAWQAIANIMVEWSLGVLKMEGLADLFATQGDPMPSGGTGSAPSSGLEVLAQRIRAINLGKSVAHTFLIDGDEDFKRETAALSGLAEVLQAFMLRLAAAVDMPVSLLMGQSPGGLRAGDDDVRFFYDRVLAKIISQLMPNWRRLIQILFRAKRTSPTRGKEPRKWTVTPRPLRQMTEKETAELRKMVADTDAVYIDRGVQSVPETTASRFGGSKWSMETTIDFEGRARMAAAGPSKPPGGSGGGTPTPRAGSGGGAGAEVVQQQRSELGGFDPVSPGAQSADPRPIPDKVPPRPNAGPATPPEKLRGPRDHQQPGSVGTQPAQPANRVPPGEKTQP